MATTFIYPIKVTGEKSLDYDTENKSAKIIEKKNDSKDSLNYIMRDRKGNIYNLSSDYIKKMKNYISFDSEENIIFQTIKTGVNCCVKNAYNEWKKVRDTTNNKRANSGNLQYCIVQNFGINLDPMIANEIGTAFATKYLADYQCVVSTHINTGLVHNHIEFNATSFVSGKKFNDNLKAVADIRKISDELCYQYELDVLEKTKDFNYIVYKDANGKTKIYEPTDRKNKIKEGEYADKNDYRNTIQFKQANEYKNNHLNELRKDIDRLLPHVDNYEDLLQQLKNVGYEIKDKTKNGTWRKHISFKAAAWDKFTRDDSLGEEYEREFLTKVIIKNKENAESKITLDEDKKVISDDVRKSDIYVYGRIVIDDIDEEYRYKKKKNIYEKVKRNNIEKYIIVDTKKLNKEINTVIRQSMFPYRERVQEIADATKKEQYLIDRINSNLKTLRFIEDREIKNFDQINDMVKILYGKRNACYNQLNAISKALKKANATIVMIDKYNSLKNTIETNANNPDYMLYEMKNDMTLLKSYESALEQRDLLSSEKQEEFKEKCKKYNNTFSQLAQALEKVNKDIREYDDCIYNIKEVDKNNGNRYSLQIESYYNEKENYNKELDR